MSTATMKATAAAAAASAQQKAGRKSASLPSETVEYLKSWMMSPEHVAHPYPTEQEKAQIMAETGIELKQLTNWFVNNRKRYWKPRVEAKLQKFGPGAANGGGGNGGSQQMATLPGGGLSIAIHHMNPKPQQQQQQSQQAQQATSFPMLPNNASAAPSMYAQAQQQAGPASPLAQPMVGLAGAMALNHHQLDAIAALPYHVQDDPHTISEGSGSSAYNSDEDSIETSSISVRAPLVAAAAQYMESCLGTASASSSQQSTTASPSSPSDGTTGYRRHEEVDVHVLRPDATPDETEEPLPTLRDLTIKTSIPKERILATFKCPISYTIPYEIEHDRKKVQSRRDGEVLRVKKHYLKLYLATQGIHSVSSPIGGDVNVPSSNSSVFSTTEAFTNNAMAVSPLTTTATLATSNSGTSRARAFTCTDLQPDVVSYLAPRKRARTASRLYLKGEDEWRHLCQNAQNVYCESLPGLEEAARMFGYVSP